MNSFVISSCNQISSMGFDKSYLKIKSLSCVHYSPELRSNLILLHVLYNKEKISISD